ncbi:MAG: DUF1289 domain-containing protein [Bacteroidales bacterium]|nr:DUF1289 domain-containing protein [Bacteroidales bacterium]
MKSEIKSPCIKVCKYDSEGNCMGCHRSMEEITNWIFMSDIEKKESLRKAEIRKQTPILGTQDYDYYV